MSGSLKDQLIALGLAAQKPKQKPKSKQESGPRQKGGKPGHAPAKPKRPPAKDAQKADNISLDAAWKARQREEQQAAEQKAAAKRAEDLRRRQMNAEVEALVKDQELNSAEAELKRNFLYKGRIRSVPVTPEQLQALNSGALGLVFLRGRYLLLPPELVAKVQALSAEHVPDLSGGDAGEDEGDYPPVPDDLVW